MKKYILTTILLITVTGISFSQSNYQIQQSLDFFRINKMQSNDWMTMLSENDIDGSPFLNDEFINGTVFTTSKTQYVDMPLRYNIYNNQLEFKTPDDEVQAMDTPEIIEKAEFGDYKMVYIPYSNVKRIFRGFFISIEEDEKASLYVKPEVTFKKAEEPGAYKEAEPAKFVRKPDVYFIRFGEDAAQRISNKKDLLNVFPNRKAEVSTFIKKNKVKYNKVDKLKSLIEYYNTLE